MDDDLSQDICRVCRCEASNDRPLFYPCICTGSIKYIHQDCLMQWMRYSHKQYCELCGHRFRFQPIYSPDMPRVLPLRDVISGLLSAVMRAAKSWFHFTLVGMAWFGVVPLSAYRTYRCLFRSPSFDMQFSWRFEAFSIENLPSDAFRGCFVVTCTLLSFIGLVWLREQILHGGGPDWLERDDMPVQVEEAAAVAAGDAAAAPVEADIPPIHYDENEPMHYVADAPIDFPINNAEPPVLDPTEHEGEAALDFAAPPINAPVAAVDAAVPALARENNARAAMGGGMDRVHAAFRAVAADMDNDNDEQNWNPMEWDRAAEELTWERLLGLDGSLVFLEHVFWIISLNTMFIFTFAFCPFCIGNFILNSLDMLQPEKPLLHFHGLITTMFGYCFIGLTLVLLHGFARIFRLRRIRWLIGFCYIVVKVSLLSVVEIGVLPLICGWWLDICSLPLFDATLKDRKTSFRAAPGTSLFVHWMFGMVYVYYFAAFISLLREVLRPGVLWFLRNLNDPDFSPIQEMIHLPILRHVRRLIASAIIFGSTVMLMLWLPIRMLKMIWPKFLPYTLSGDSEVNELSLQLLLLQIILPGFFEQSHTRVWLKGLLRIWCMAVSWLLGIRSYLLGTEQQTTEAEEQPAAAVYAEQANEVVQEQPHLDEQQKENMPLLDQAEEREVEELMDAAPAPPPPPMPVGADAEDPVQHRDVPLGFQPYTRQNFFAVRLLGLMMFVCISLIIASLITLTVPVWIGRQVMALWSVGGLITNANPVAQHLVGTPDVSARSHELYTAALGTYLCWVFSRAIAIAAALVPLGRAAIMDKVKHWMRVAASYTLPVLIFICLLSIIPLLFGLLLELVVVIPLRVSWYQTPVHFLWQSWALGVLYTKISIALTLMGPDWHMKRGLERAYRDGLRDIDLKFLIKYVAAPVVISLGSALAVPYVLAHTVIPLFVQDKMTLHNISRIMYPLCFLLLVVIAYIYFEIHQFKKLYVSIKVNKYLVGQRLVNYVDSKRKQEAEAARSAAAAKVAAAIGIPKDEEDATGVAFETIKEPPPAEPVINTLEVEMLEQKQRDENTLIYRPQIEDVDEMDFGNDLL